MPGHVIFFSVVLGAAAMGVGGKVTVLSGDLLRFVHTIAGARVVPSVAPGQTKAGPPGAGAEVAVGSAGSTWRMQISRSDCVRDRPVLADYADESSGDGFGRQQPGIFDRERSKVEVVGADPKTDIAVVWVLSALAGPEQPLRWNSAAPTHSIEMPAATML
jgi:S1-C subfamily serine protease